LILQFEAAMTNFPYATGYSPQRWRLGTDIMLEKKAGNFWVDKLRAFLLYEADFNQNNIFLGRAMMRNAELKKIQAKEQYGSRKKMSAIDQCLNKRLTFDKSSERRQYARMTRKSATIASCIQSHPFACNGMESTKLLSSVCLPRFKSWNT